MFYILLFAGKFKYIFKKKETFAQKVLITDQKLFMLLSNKFFISFQDLSHVKDTPSVLYMVW